MTKKTINYKFLNVGIPAHHAEKLIEALKKTEDGAPLDKQEIKQIKAMRGRLLDALEFEKATSEMTHFEKTQYFMDMLM